MFGREHLNGVEGGRRAIDVIKFVSGWRVAHTIVPSFIFIADNCVDEIVGLGSKFELTLPEIKIDCVTTTPLFTRLSPEAVRSLFDDATRARGSFSSTELISYGCGFRWRLNLIKTWLYNSSRRRIQYSGKTVHVQWIKLRQSRNVPDVLKNPFVFIAEGAPTRFVVA